MIGTLGRAVIFSVSDRSMLTFSGLSREVSGRWAQHETFGSKPRSEFLGAGNRAVTLTIHLSAAMGVKPRRVIDALARLVESGDAEYLVIGGKPMAAHPFRVVSTSEAWDAVYNRGELAKATVSITLEEYV